MFVSQTIANAEFPHPAAWNEGRRKQWETKTVLVTLWQVFNPDFEHDGSVKR
jgi:hypothetical protein